MFGKHFVRVTFGCNLDFMSREINIRDLSR